MFRRLARFQFAATGGDGGDAQARDLSEGAITAMSQPLGFESDTESALMFIERAQQEIDPRVQGFRR
jgi:hypothetical protein